MRRVIICGSRAWVDERVVKEFICSLVTAWGDVTVVHGDCPTGADHFAAKWAPSRGAHVEAHPAEWEKYGRRAGPLRNQKMAALGADLCVAFWFGTSPGTASMLGEAAEHGIPCHEYVAGKGWIGGDP